MRIWLVLVIAMTSLMVRCAELRKGKRSTQDSQYDSLCNVDAKKAKYEESFDFDKLVKQVEIWRNELHATPGALLHMNAVRQEITERFVKNSLGEGKIDVIYYDMVCMALYSIAPKDLPFYTNPYYNFFKIFMKTRVEFEKSSVSIESFREAFRLGKADLYLKMKASQSADNDLYINLTSSSDSEHYKHNICTMLLLQLWPKDHHAIPLIEYLLQQNLDITSNDYAIMRNFVYQAENLELIEYFVNLWSKDPNIDLSVLLDLAIEAPNTVLMQVLASYCPQYDYSKAFHVVCDSSFDGVYGPHEEKFRAFSYLLSILDPNLLLNLNSDGHYPLAMSQGPLLQKILLFLINYHKNLFVKLIRNNALYSRYETAGIDFQAIDEVIDAMKSNGLCDLLTFDSIDSLFRMREETDEEEPIAPGNLQAITLLICLRHNIAIETEIITDEVIDRALTLLNQIYFGGRPLVNAEGDENTLECVKRKYAQCKSLLRKYTKSRFFPCEIINPNDSSDISMAQENAVYAFIQDDFSESEEDPSDEDTHTTDDSIFDPFNLGFYGVDYDLGFNIFFSHSEFLEILIEKIENKSLDGLCYFLKVLDSEGYLPKLVCSILRYALNNDHMWASIMIYQHFPALLIVNNSSNWQELIECPNFCKLIEIVHVNK